MCHAGEMMVIRMTILILLLAGCSAGEQIEVDITGDKSEQLLKFYFGSYIREDPFRIGILVKRNGRFYLDIPSLRKLKPELTEMLQSKVSGNRLSSEDLQEIVQSTYYDARNLPSTLIEFRAQSTAEIFQSFEVHGPVTRYLRRITISEHALQDAILNYYKNDRKLKYATGTVIQAEHISGDHMVEATVMVKRSDGFWDFATYDSTGSLTSQTLPNPRSLSIPTQCVGCHLGRKGFDPEQSWPLDAAQAPDGIRKWYTGARDQEVIDFFTEHTLRSDMVLGIYATVYVSDLRAQRRLNTLDSAGTALLDDIGL